MLEWNTAVVVKFTSSAVSVVTFCATLARLCTASITVQAEDVRSGKGVFPRVSVKIIS